MRVSVAVNSAFSCHLMKHFQFLYFFHLPDYILFAIVHVFHIYLGFCSQQSKLKAESCNHRRDTVKGAEKKGKIKKEEDEPTIFTVGWKRGRRKKGKRKQSTDIEKRRKGISTDFNITTVGAESRNSVGGTEDSLCRQFTKKTIKVETFPCSSMKHNAFPEIYASLSLSLPEVGSCAGPLHNSVVRNIFICVIYVSSSSAFLCYKLSHQNKNVTAVLPPSQLTWIYNFTGQTFVLLKVVGFHFHAVSLCFFPTFALRRRLLPGNNTSETCHFVNLLSHIPYILMQSIGTSPNSSEFQTVTQNDLRWNYCTYCSA